MQTLGDILYNTRRFFSLKRTMRLSRQVFNPVLLDDPPGGEYALAYDYAQQNTERTALYSSWVYTAIRRIAMSTMAARINIKRRVGEETEDIPNHPLELLFQSPNPDMSREYVWMFTHFSMQLAGRAFWFLYPDNRGNVAELWPIPHYLVRPAPDESPSPSRLFSHYTYQSSGGKSWKLPVENVVYLRFPHPFDPYQSLSPLAAGGLAVLLDRTQARWNTRTFGENGGLPTNLISVSPETAESEFLAFKADLKKHHGQNMTVRGGDIKIERLSMTNEEAQYLETRKFNRSEIFDVFGVPDDSQSSEAGIKELNRQFINNTVWPLLEFMAGQITTGICQPLFGPDIFAEFTDIRPQDRALAVQEATQYWPVLTLNEARAERGLDALPKIEVEIDEESAVDLWDDVPMRVLPEFLAFLGKKEEEAGPIPPQLAAFTGGDNGGGFNGPPGMQDAQSPAAAQEQDEDEAAGIEEEQPEDDETEAKALTKWMTVAISGVKAGGAGKVYRDDAIPESDSLTMAAVLGLCRTPAEVKAVFADSGLYRSANAIKAVLNKRDQVPKERLKLEDEFSDEIEAFLAAQSRRVAEIGGGRREPPGNDFWDKENLLLAAMLTPYVEKWAAAGIGDVVTNILAPIGMGLDADVNARAAEWAGQHALEMAKGLNKTTHELAKAKIRNWLQTGKPLDNLAQSLSEIIAPRWRAELIASTEVTRAWAEAAEQIAKEWTVIKGEVWATANDERVCPICGALDGKEKKVGGTFPGGIKAPPAHPRCRCGLTYTV